MPHPAQKKKKKKQRVGDHDECDVSNNFDKNCMPITGIDALSTDELALIFGYLRPENIMRARLNKKMRDAAIKTIVPTINFTTPSPTRQREIFSIRSPKKYNAMAAMAYALPHLQQISINNFDPSYNCKYSDGIDPDELRVYHCDVSNWETRSIDILANFRRLSELEISADLNGRYPMLFNFPHLQTLRIYHARNLKWDLDMLAGLPSLQDLYSLECKVTGDIKSLRLLKNTISSVVIRYSRGVQGNFMDLADFPHLKHLDLDDTSVTGDIREIGNCDFSSLKYLNLPSGVYGGTNFKFQRISDAQHIMDAIYVLKKQHPNIELAECYAQLSEDSPERYECPDYIDIPMPPFFVELVKAGSRLGWRWIDGEICFPCEVNWLDPEPPDKGSVDYEEYIQNLPKVEEKLNFFKGFYQPPTEEEYHRILEEMSHGLHVEEIV